LHQEDADIKDTHSTSRLNPSQAANACKILAKLAAALPYMSIVCLCLYSGELHNLRSLMPNSPIRFITVDGYQSQEADLIYLLTTRSLADEPKATQQRSRYGDPLKFVKDARRATVALSRGKSGLFIHGNLRTLALGSVWNNFIRAALEKTFVVNPSQFADNCHKSDFLHMPIELDLPAAVQSQEVVLLPEGPSCNHRQ
jgi:superfamily I DNA and/or RNA helicase